MKKVIFIYNGNEYPFICNLNRKIKYYCQKFCQIKNININNVYFIYNQKNLDFDLTVGVLNPIKILLEGIIILVFDKKNDNILDKVLFKSNEIVCPKCKKFAKIFINENKISFSVCENNHYISFLKDRPDDIKCDKGFFQCSKGELYKCNICKIYFCENHKSSHEQIEKICNYQKNLSFKKTEEKNNINFNINNNYEITIQYNIDLNETDEEINIFGLYFVNQNKNKCKMVCNGYQFDIQPKLNINFINTYLRKDKNYFEIKLIGVNITDMSGMFEGTSLRKVSFPLNFDTSYITDMSYMFAGCSSLLLLPDISNWNTINVKNMAYMFSSCILLNSLPDLSKWNTMNVTDMSYMFAFCTSLKSLPNLSKWNTKNVESMNGLFNSLKINYLPDISKWDTSNLTTINAMFYKCSKLLNVPDISQWNVTKIKNFSYLFYNCSSLSFIPDISKWETTNIEDINYMFSGCSSITSLPNISNWKFNNYMKIDDFISGCISLAYLPENFKFKKNINEIRNCVNLINKF